MRGAQRIDRCELQTKAQQQKPGRHWRTRADPLAEVWDSVLVPMLEKAPQLEPQTLLLDLERTFPDQEWFGVNAPCSATSSSGVPSTGPATR